MTRRNPPPRMGPEWSRRYTLPFEEAIEGEAQVHYAAELDRCVIISPNGGVKIGASHLEQCVIVEPCTIGDGVKAVAAILQGEIGDGCRIEAHADIRGVVGDHTVIGRGVVVEEKASVGRESEIGDMVTIGEEADVGDAVHIGAQSVIGPRARVRSSAVLPARSIVRPGSYAVETSTERQKRERLGPDDAVGFHFVDAFDEETEVEEPDQDHDEEGEPEDEEGWPSHRMDPADFVPAMLSFDRSARPGEMARGSPYLVLRDFRPGSARSWVLSKLGRLANLRSKDGRLTKKLVTEFRPDLLEHPVTKEVLRVAPPITDEKLAALSFESLSPARYDVYGNITFHSGRADQQMIGPQANDVFVFAVPDSVLKELDAKQRKLSDLNLKWHGTKREHFYDGDWAGGRRTFGEVVRNEDDTPGAKKWLAYTFEIGYGNERTDFWAEFDDLDDAKRAVEDAFAESHEAMASRDVSKFDSAFAERVNWHPDKDVKHPIGWVRLVVVQPSYVLVVEIQSDQPWMKFGFEGRAPAQNALREMYFPTFAADVINFVVEWAFTNRYREVLVLDHASRRLLGGSPPKSFYDDVPKKYTVSPLFPLDSIGVIPIYDNLPHSRIKVRRIVPNRGSM